MLPSAPQPPASSNQSTVILHRCRPLPSQPSSPAPSTESHHRTPSIHRTSPVAVISREGLCHPRANQPLFCDSTRECPIHSPSPSSPSSPAFHHRPFLISPTKTPPQFNPFSDPHHTTAAVSGKVPICHRPSPLRLQQPGLTLTRLRPQQKKKRAHFLYRTTSPVSPRPSPPCGFSLQSPSLSIPSSSLPDGHPTHRSIPSWVPSAPGRQASTTPPSTFHGTPSVASSAGLPRIVAGLSHLLRSTSSHSPSSRGTSSRTSPPPSPTFDLRGASPISAD